MLKTASFPHVNKYLHCPHCHIATPSAPSTPPLTTPDPHDDHLHKLTGEQVHGHPVQKHVDLVNGSDMSDATTVKTMFESCTNVVHPNLLNWRPVTTSRVVTGELESGTPVQFPVAKASKNVLLNASCWTSKTKHLTVRWNCVLSPNKPAIAKPVSTTTTTFPESTTTTWSARYNGARGPGSPAPPRAKAASNGVASTASMRTVLVKGVTRDGAHETLWNATVGPVRFGITPSGGSVP
jgi:hypothetical protein